MVTKAWQDKVCGCGRKFRTGNGSSQCYDCHLLRISGGRAPEEGDFNSAHLAAGDWDERQEREFQRELRNVELGLPSDYTGPDPYDPEDDDDEDDDRGDPYEDYEEPGGQSLIVASHCPYCDYVTYNDMWIADGSDLDAVAEKERLEQEAEHNRQSPNCPGELMFSS